jgi:hypothetical protein
MSKVTKPSLAATLEIVTKDSEVYTDGTSHRDAKWEAEWIARYGYNNGTREIEPDGIEEIRIKAVA